MLRHQDPADEQAIHFLPDFLEAPDEVVAEAWGKENGRPPVGAGGDELQFTRAVSAMIDGYAGFEYTRGDGRSGRGSCGGGRAGVSLRDIADLKGLGSAPAREL